MSFKTIIQQVEEIQIAAIEAALPQMEPAALHCGPIDTVAQVSLAISMKRIADQIEGVQRLGLVDGIMAAIEQGIINATRR